MRSFLIIVALFGLAQADLTAQQLQTVRIELLTEMAKNAGLQANFLRLGKYLNI
jgi:hypothetical protein